ncbi:MAG TPA: NUDIX hydrolase [Oligoflexia bacterium]|nr:NUDIX hydrolase [Oligoflexia bacterium]HMP48746.1 NUDIX hydrolase [Oligoflexia bacterium]
MSIKNPWKTLSTRTVYKNPWIEVKEDKVITPGGGEGIYGVVHSKIATGVVAITKNLDIIMVGQYRYPMNEYSWEIVQGGAEHGEDPMQGAIRELQEEAGILAEKVVLLGEEVHLSNCHSSERAFLYLAENLTQTDANPDDCEILEVKHIPFKDVLEMVENGKIRDAMTIIGVYRAARAIGII